MDTRETQKDWKVANLLSIYGQCDIDKLNRLFTLDVSSMIQSIPLPKNGCSDRLVWQNFMGPKLHVLDVCNHIAHSQSQHQVVKLNWI